MAAYDFVALDGRGKQRRGVLEADSVRQIRQLIRDRGWAPLQVKASSEKSTKEGQGQLLSFGGGISAFDLSMVTRQLSTLIQAGLPVDEALHAVAQQSEKRRLRSMITAVRGRVLEGHALAQALAAYPRAFPDLYRSTVSAGEHSGHLDLVLSNLADYTEQRQESRQNVQMALLYPVILFLVAGLVVVGLLVYVVPKIVRVFDDTGQELPLLTQWLIASSEFLQSYLLVLVAVIAVLAIGVRWLLRQPAVKSVWHQQLMTWPLIRRISRGVNAAQYTSTLAILTSSGVPLVEGMRIAGSVLTNEHLKGRVEGATQQVSEGSSLRGALEGVGYFPPMMLHMVASGEASGELDTMLSRVAQHQSRDMERLATAMVKLFEPIMLLVMGLVVLLIVLAILLPILNLNQVVF